MPRLWKSLDGRSARMPILTRHLQSEQPIWLDMEILIDLHAEQLALFGGPDGIRDQNMLESALGRPINKFTYGETDLAALAASYAFGIARNHHVVDGNKT